MTDVVRSDSADPADRRPFLEASVFDAGPTIVDHVVQVLGPSINQLFSERSPSRSDTALRTQVRSLRRQLDPVR